MYAYCVNIFTQYVFVHEIKISKLFTHRT
jgi:hypothetical protein